MTIDLAGLPRRVTVAVREASLDFHGSRFG
jgi:hypothetical protein